MGQQIAAGISKTSTQIGQSLAKVGQGLTKTGSALTTNLTLPLLAAGGAVTHFALDFDTTMRRIVGLAKVPQEEIEGVRDEILKMGEEIGRSPQELAEAFYFVASAGFKAEEAMEVLRISATAAAAGMGQTQDIAKTLGGVINAYGHENLSAAHAGDVLTAAIQDGAAEASDFAGVIGFVVPVSASLGVSFDQVAAALSAMTQVGISADTAATNLGQVMAALQKPTAEAEEAMEGLGLSSAGLREELSEKGLLATLRTLEERFAGNEEAAVKVFGNIRALRGVTALLGLDTEQLNGIFADTAGALDNLQGAYDDTAGPQRELDKAMASLQTTAIELGADTLPMVVDVLKQIAGGVREFAKWWRSLDADTRKQIVQWLAWLAVAGPVLLIVGKLVTAVGALFKVVGFLAGPKGIPALASASGKARLMMLGWVGVIAALTFGLIEGSDALSDFLHELTMGKKAAKVLKDLEEIAGNDKFAKEIYDWGISVEDFQKVVDRAGGDAETAFHAIEDAGGDLGKALWQLSLDSEDAVGGMVVGFGRNLKEARAAAAAAGKEIPTTVAAALVDGQWQVEEAAKDFPDPIAEALEKAKQDVADAANDLLHTLATTLSSNPQELRDAAQQMIEDILHPFPDAKHRLEIEAILARKEWVKGLTSKDSGDRARTAEYLKGILAEYESLAPGALAAGELINPALQDGIDSTLDALTTYLETQTGDILDQYDLADELYRMGYAGLAEYVRGQEDERHAVIDTAAGLRLRIVKELNIDLYDAGRTASQTWVGGFTSTGISAVDRWLNTVKVRLIGLSPPPEGPLKGLDVGAARAADSWVTRFVERLRAGIPAISSAIGQVAGAMALQPAGLAAAAVPSMGSVASGAAGSVGTGTTTINNTWQLVVNGVPYTFNTRDDFIKALDDLSAFGDGRLDG